MVYGCEVMIRSMQVLEVDVTLVGLLTSWVSCS